MNDQTFQIKIIDLHWINNVDDPKDLCAHGLVYIRIGDQIISDENSGNWTLSSTALYLLRTIKDNYNPNDFPSQLVPCCGHFRIIDEKTNKVLILVVLLVLTGLLFTTAMKLNISVKMGRVNSS